LFGERSGKVKEVKEEEEAFNVSGSATMVMPACLFRSFESREAREEFDLSVPARWCLSEFLPKRKIQEAPIFRVLKIALAGQRLVLEPFKTQAE